MVRVVLVRHGHTAWNTSKGQDKRFRGTVDLPLASDGVLQAKATARFLADRPLSAIYSSPLQRAARTAEIIAEPHGLRVQSLPGLQSMNYGAWAGQYGSQVARLWPDLYTHWLQDPFGVQIPDGERASDFRDRVAVSIRTVLPHHDNGDTIVIVSHQAVIKTLVCVLGGLPNTAYWQVRQDLCNLSRFDYDPAADSFALVGLNDTCHLDTQLPGVTDGNTRILLIRHGQTAWNIGAGDERFRGRTDLPLDETGRAQALAVARRLQGEQIVAVYTSPLLRTRQTGMPLAGEFGLPVQSHKGLIDIDYGCFQGLFHSEAATAYPDLYALWRTRPGQVHFPGGEGLEDVRVRIRALLAEMASRHAGQTIALIGHQIVNKALACTLLGLDLDQIWRVQQDTCGIDLFQRMDKSYHTLALNDVCHLRSGGV